MVVRAAAGMNSKDQDKECLFLFLRKEHSPFPHSQPEDLFLHDLQTLHVPLTGLRKAIDRSNNSLLGPSIQTLQVLFRTACPADLTAH